MPDFIDRLSAELLRAATAPEDGRDPAAAPKRQRFGGLRHRSRRLRGLVIGGLVALVATPALAVTQPWNPAPRQIVVRKGASPHGDVPSGRVSISSAAPTREQLALLGILRRPAHALDHSPRVAAALGHLFGGFRGVKLRFVRVLSDSPGEPLVLLIPAQGWSGPPLPGGGSADSVPDPLCVDVVLSPNSGGGNCLPTEALTAGHLAGSAGLFEYGVIPDGVASVVLHFPDGTRQSVPVHGNFIGFSGTPSAGSPGRPKLFSSIDWLDSQGKLVRPGPPGQR